MSVRPAKTRISLDIRPVWSESSLSAWRMLKSLAIHWAHSKASDQTGRKLILLVLLCRSSAHFEVSQETDSHRRPAKAQCAPSEDSDQPGHPSSLIRVFAVRMKNACVLSYPLSTQQSLWSDWAQTHFVGFAMSKLSSLRSFSRNWLT